MGSIFIFIGGVLFGLLFAYILAYLSIRKGAIGTIRCDYSDRDCPYLFLELDPGKSHRLQTGSYITLRVNFTQK